MDLRSAGDQERLSQYREAGRHRAPLYEQPVRNHDLALAGRPAHRPPHRRMVAKVETGREPAEQWLVPVAGNRFSNFGARSDLRMESFGRLARSREGCTGRKSRAILERVRPWFGGAGLRAR